MRCGNRWQKSKECGHQRCAGCGSGHMEHRTLVAVGAMHASGERPPVTALLAHQQSSRATQEQRNGVWGRGKGGEAGRHRGRGGGDLRQNREVGELWQAPQVLEDGKVLVAHDAFALVAGGGPRRPLPQLHGASPLHTRRVARLQERPRSRPQARGEPQEPRHRMHLRVTAVSSCVREGQA